MRASTATLRWCIGSVSTSSTRAISYKGVLPKKAAPSFIIMIVYHLELFGVHLLPRAHGSAVYRAILPSCISTSILLIGAFGSGVPPGASSLVSDSYAIGVFIAFFTYLVTFRANFAYKRVSGNIPNEASSEFQQLYSHPLIYYFTTAVLAGSDFCVSDDVQVA